MVLSEGFPYEVNLLTLIIFQPGHPFISACSANIFQVSSPASTFDFNLPRTVHQHPVLPPVEQ